jgi:pimeloyl-ACP methyl ester carboxylesterase
MVGRIVGFGLILMSVIGGCTKSMTPGKMQWVQAESNEEHVGNAYLIRGWLGLFSSGMDHLTVKINNVGVRAHVFQEDQWYQLAQRLRAAYRVDTNHEPLILVGHSWGADDTLRVAQELEKDHIPVDLIITLDPVTPPLVPPNVKRCINIYESNGLWDTIPAWRGIPLKAESERATLLTNSNVRVDRLDLLEPDTDHGNIEKNVKIHAEVLKEVLELCPPRSLWMAHRGPNNMNEPTHTMVTNQRSSERTMIGE